MIELPNVLDAYVADRIVLHTTAPAMIDEQEVTALLASLDVELESAVPNDAATF